MTLFLSDPDVTLYHGDALGVLKTLPSESVHMCVTSPPFYGLRSYLDNGHPDKPLEIGLEETPESWCEALVAVFREVRRVLRADGTLWLEVGDSYGANNAGVGRPNEGHVPNAWQHRDVDIQTKGGAALTPIRHPYKPKDLIGAPWMLAFALRADGWVLRSEICWSRPNPMPESVTDRPTKAHSTIFLFAKAKRIGPEPTRFENLPEADKRWLATMLDTEGCILVRRNKNEGRADTYGPQITIVNTSKALMGEVERIVGDAGRVSVKEGKNRPVMYWQASHSAARDLLHAVYPYLIAKQAQARVAIHAATLVRYRGTKTDAKKRRTDAESAALERCWLTSKALNQGEPVDDSFAPEPRYGSWVPQRYFFDQEAVREPLGDSNDSRLAALHRHGDGTTGEWVSGSVHPENPHRNQPDHRGLQGVGTTFGRFNSAGRNIRSVWTIATQPYPEAHFATFPEELARRCILAGTSERGCCPECGAPWVREIESRLVKSPVHGAGSTVRGRGEGTDVNGWAGETYPRLNRETTTIGWRPSCGCGDRHPEPNYATIQRTPVPCVVLDPFVGSGTVPFVARKFGRHAIGIDLNAQYLELAAKRLQQQSLFAHVPDTEVAK